MKYFLLNSYNQASVLRNFVWSAYLVVEGKYPPLKILFSDYGAAVEVEKGLSEPVRRALVELNFECREKESLEETNAWLDNGA